MNDCVIPDIDASVGTNGAPSESIDAVAPDTLDAFGQEIASTAGAPTVRDSKTQSSVQTTGSPVAARPSTEDLSVRNDEESLDAFEQDPEEL